MAANSIFSNLEHEVLKRWQKQEIFKKTLAKTANGKKFVFFEGPPTANGMPHIGHVQGRAIKDVVCRYKSMQGFFVERKAGWDTHGLPVELQVEKDLGLKSKNDIEAYGIEKFNAKCRDSVWKYKGEWEKMTERIGYWLDLERPYITYDKNYVESLWWVIKQIWDNDLLYKGYKVVPQCPRCGTALSSHEVAQGYEKVVDKSIYVKFQVTSDKGQVKKGDYILAWTTTPWTLPGNVALAVGLEIAYVRVIINGAHYVLAKDRLAAISDSAEIVNEINGADLIGIEYQPLFKIEAFKKDKQAYKIYEADFVTLNEGTGIVHTAVMYGVDDYQLGEKVGLPKKHTVNPDGTFNDLVPQWQGKFVKDPEVERGIVDDLKSRDLLYSTEQYTHDYPFCWRCHSPLIYYAKDSWFIKMSALRVQLLKNNKTINWYPGYIKDGRFGEWLKDAKDWAFSRERYWGTPLPIWECQKIKCAERVCVGSYEELGQLSGKKLDDDFDPHRPFVDDVTIKCSKCGGEMRRVKELCDVWFDSGCMPFAQWHYPFENKERIDDKISYPADYISEAIDQTRGWFYTLLAVSTALGQDAPFRNVICQAHVMDAKGKKMSKHIGNVVDPNVAIEEFGADIVRWFFLTASQPGEAKNYDPKSLTEIMRKNFMVLSNVLSFFKLYAGENIVTKKTPHILDQWIIDLTYRLVAETTKRMDNYQITEAGRGITNYIDDLSTWYLRRSRDRFKDPNQRDQAVDTLRHVLQTTAKLLAPFAPFYAEELYQQTGGAKKSVHLEDWPKPRHEPESEVLHQMTIVRSVAEIAHSIRSELGVKVRQPLSQLVVTGTTLPSAYTDVLSEEANVVNIIVESDLPKGPEWVIKMTGIFGVALNSAITPELAAQGLVRELVRQTNSVRKKNGLTIHDQVDLYLNADPADILDTLKLHSKKIETETLSRKVHFGELPKDIGIQGEFKVESGKVLITIVK